MVMSTSSSTMPALPETCTPIPCPPLTIPHQPVRRLHRTLHRSAHQLRPSKLFKTHCGIQGLPKTLPILSLRTSQLCITPQSHSSTFCTREISGSNGYPLRLFLDSPVRRTILLRFFPFLHRVRSAWIPRSYPCHILLQNKPAHTSVKSWQICWHHGASEVMCLPQVCGLAVGCRVVGRVALLDKVTEMTTNPAPGVKLDPDTLADTVPLRRVGTIKVCCGKFNVRISELTGERIWPEQHFSWLAVQGRMSMGQCGWWMGGGLGRFQAHIRISGIIRI